MSGWYYLVGDEQKGPVDEATIRALSPETQVWNETLPEWKLAKDVFQPADASVPARPSGPPPILCAGCRSPGIVPGYSIPLCQSCRTTLVNAPIPLWLRITIGIIVVLMIYSATRLPNEFRAGIAFDRGEAADAKGNFKESEQHYQEALSIYPDSCDILASLALAADAAGDKETLGKCMDTLVEKAKTSEDAKIALGKVARHWMSEGRQK